MAGAALRRGRAWLRAAARGCKLVAGLGGRASPQRRRPVARLPTGGCTAASTSAHLDDHEDNGQAEGGNQLALDLQRGAGCRALRFLSVPGEQQTQGQPNPWWQIARKPKQALPASPKAAGHQQLRPPGRQVHQAAAPAPQRWCQPRRPPSGPHPLVRHALLLARPSSQLADADIARHGGCRATGGRAGVGGRRPGGGGRQGRGGGSCSSLQAHRCSRAASRRPLTQRRRERAGASAHSKAGRKQRAGALQPPLCIVSVLAAHPGAAARPVRGGRGRSHKPQRLPCCSLQGGDWRPQKASVQLDRRVL